MEQHCLRGNYPTYTIVATLRRVFRIVRLASLGRAFNIASTARKDLSYPTYFNCNKKGHYTAKCPKAREDSNVEG